MKKTISLALILVLIATTLVGCGGAAYKDGSYSGEAVGMYPLKVTVDVKDGKISNVDVDHEETDGIGTLAVDSIPGAIVAKNSTDVDGVSGATLTSNGIKEAVNKALEGAK